ncbi:MarR family transcriptional regulator [Actinomycetospora sp. NBRC 106375]|uniref:MarR family winged helix-turn-helix transcriptional regulator n=1 Tax=Actinomycetospora sp. NBRC 106375 TaxID=3032207 RepID=UPI0024A55163|nr:MarR family transcriptional regulator [Actinomycetospora sp. NBRC 106375]GLZ45980.1 MarR family transcriptional regulator [Actinomycetospora sp. NBRC 106375]
MARVTPDLSFLLDKTSESLAARMTTALADLGLTARQYCVLDKASAADRTQGQIAEEALLDKTTMVTTLDGLERAGLARRVPSPTDRRARLVETTAEGEALVEKAATVIQGLYDEVLGALGADRDTVVDGLTRLVEGPLRGGVDARPPRRSSRT